MPVSADRREPEVAHPVPIDEVPAWSRAASVTFLHESPGGQSDRWVRILTELWDPDRAWGARVADRWVATLRTEERWLTVPGSGGTTEELRVDALTAVTVAATHRRHGLMARMLTASLAAAHERGDALSALIAAEWPIYGRFGYAPATVSTAYALHRARRGCACEGDPSRVVPVERESFLSTAPAVFAAARRRDAGQIDRSPRWWKLELGVGEFAPNPDLPHNWLVHEGDNGPDGLLAWSARNATHALTPPLGDLSVWGLYAATDEAYRDLWSYLSGVDGVDRIVLEDRPVDEPVRWLLTDGRSLETTGQVDFLWLRILDVPAALSARRYAVDGEIVLEVRDGQAGGFADGRYRLASSGSDAVCELTRASADLEITQSALSAAFLGGVRLRALPRGVVEHTPGALERADLMFSTPRAPWNATGF